MGTISSPNSKDQQYNPRSSLFVSSIRRGSQSVLSFCPNLHLTTRKRCKSGDDMAAYGGHDAAADLGNQIFVTMRKGKDWPPASCDVRIRYDQTIADVKAAIAEKMKIDAGKMKLFWHKKELSAAFDGKTLLQMNMHTGFAVRGYDLTVEPDFWPPVQQTEDGSLVEV